MCCIMGGRSAAPAPQRPNPGSAHRSTFCKLSGRPAGQRTAHGEPSPTRLPALPNCREAGNLPRFLSMLSHVRPCGKGPPSFTLEHKHRVGSSAATHMLLTQRAVLFCADSSHRGRAGMPFTSKRSQTLRGNGNAKKPKQGAGESVASSGDAPEPMAVDHGARLRWPMPICSKCPAYS